jgi:DNA-binding transcriptional regulator of glucitol operon
MTLIVSLIGAIAAGMVVQTILTFKQTSAFSAAVRDLRQHGAVSVGGGGKRYRGGKAFVAIAADDRGRVTKAVSLSGWTTFARPTELHHVQGLKLSQLRREEPIPLIRPRERSALQNAAQTLHQHLVKAA